MQDEKSRQSSMSSVIQEAVRKLDADRLMHSQRQGSDYQQEVKKRLNERKRQKQLDYDAEVELLASL